MCTHAVCLQCLCNVYKVCISDGIKQLTSVVYAAAGQGVSAGAHEGVEFTIKGVVMGITRYNAVL